MDDMIIKLYELNEHYHDTKEKMAWLGSSLYFTFSLAIMRFLFIQEIQTIIKKYPWIIVIFVLTLFGCVLRFVCLQYRKKRISAGISNKFMDIVNNNELTAENKVKRMIKYTRCINDKWRALKNKHKKEWKKYGFAELPVHILMIIFFVSQIILLLYKSKC